MADHLVYAATAAERYDRTFGCHVSARFVPALLNAARLVPGIARSWTSLPRPLGPPKPRQRHWCRPDIITAADLSPSRPDARAMRVSSLGTTPKLRHDAVEAGLRLDRARPTSHFRSKSDASASPERRSGHAPRAIVRVGRNRDRFRRSGLAHDGSTTSLGPGGSAARTRGEPPELRYRLGLRSAHGLAPSNAAATRSSSHRRQAVRPTGSPAACRPRRSRTAG